MILNFLIDKKFSSRRLEYTIRTIAIRLGYPYKIIFEPKSIKPQDITITYLPADQLRKLPLQALINIFNSKQIEDLDHAERVINLFEWHEQSLPVIGNRIQDKDISGFRVFKNDIFYQKTKTNTWLIPIDIFLNVFYHLSRYEEKWRHFTEETATDYSASILSRYQELRIPIVDVLIAYLDTIIRDRLKNDKKFAVKILAWPNAEEIGVAFTHDIDITRSVHMKTRITKIGKGYISRLLGKGDLLSKTKMEINQKDANSWNLPELLSSYSKVGWRATFFFLAKIMEGSHFRYNISSKKFKKLFEQLKSEKHEIALHPSKFAFDRPKYYREEKARLEAVSGVKVEGMRQHFLRAKFPRLWEYVEKAALSYDASLGYNFQAGFRAGTSHPFKTYDVFNDKPLSVIEFSLHLFEYNLPQGGEDLQKSKELITHLLEQVSAYNGLFTCLLHPSNYHKSPFNELWKYLQEELEKRRIYVTTLNNHLNWQRNKERINVHIMYKSKDIPEINISLPAQLHQIALEFIGDFEPIDNKDVSIERIQKKYYLISTKRQQTKISVRK